MENTSKNLFETFADAQKQMVDNMTSATQQMAKSFQQNDLNSDFFKKWYDSQMSFFNQNGKNSDANPANIFTSWMNNQVNMGNEYLASMQNNFRNLMGNAGAGSDLTSMYTNWFTAMNNTIQQMMKSMNSAGDMKNAMSGMFNNAEMMMKMYEMWMPFAKMVSDKSFTPEAFKSMINPNMFKDIVDRMLSLQPDFVKNMTDTAALREQFFNLVDHNKTGLEQLRNSFNAFMPNNAAFGSMTEQYNSLWNNMSQATAPVMKMLGNNALSSNLNAISDIINEFNLFMMKNAELQYETYKAGNNALNEFAETVYTKMKNGEPVNDFMAVYSEFLGTSDKHLTTLFATPGYSKLQAELNTFGMKLKQHMNAQMEKALKNVPVVPRSEMDELYKTIYELRKRVNMLEKQLDAETETPAETKETRPAARKAAKNA